MQKANCRVRLSAGHDVPLIDVTPAEAQFLHGLHQNNTGGVVVTNIVITGEAMSQRQRRGPGDQVISFEVPRTASEEMGRLKQKYNVEHLAAAFTGGVLPDTFEELVKTVDQPDGAPLQEPLFPDITYLKVEPMPAPAPEPTPQEPEQTESEEPEETRKSRRGR